MAKLREPSASSAIPHPQAKPGDDATLRDLLMVLRMASPLRMSAASIVMDLLRGQAATQCAHDALAEVLKKAEPGGAPVVAVVAGAVVIVASGGFA
jgi:hypothetical protein